LPRLFRFYLVEFGPFSKKIYSPGIRMDEAGGVCSVGVLVRTAQTVETRINQARRQFEPKLRLKLREVKSKWLELKGRGPNVSSLNGAELQLRVFLRRTDARLRFMIAKLIGRIIVELEKVRRTLPRG
jgi:hypothetical protein